MAFFSISGQEKCMIARYVVEMEKVSKMIRKKIMWRGLVNSTTQSIPFFAYAAALCYGGFLVAYGEIHFKNVIKCVLHFEFKFLQRILNKYLNFIC